MSKGTFWQALAMLACFLLAGCDAQKTNEAKRSPVAMVDLDRVAVELGFNAKYQEYLASYRAKLKQSLEEVLIPMQKDLEQLQEELRGRVNAIPEAERKRPGFKAPAEVEQVYRRVVAQQQQIQAETRAREAKLQEYDRKMKQDFQAAIQPALAVITQAQGVQLVVPRGSSLYVAPEVDLTTMLIARLKAQPISLPAPPADVP